jgi:hypothetical protein
MAFVLVFAVGLTALRNASDLWAGMMLLVALAGVGIAVLGAVILRGRERHWWTGFAFFGGGYLALTSGPWLSDTFQPLLGTTHLLSYVHEQVVARAERGNYRVALIQYQRARRQLLNAEQRTRVPNEPTFVDLRNNLDSAWQDVRKAASGLPRPPINGWLSLLPGATNLEEFQRVGHALFTLLAGLLGGMIAGWFSARRERAEEAAG